MSYFEHCLYLFCSFIALKWTISGEKEFRNLDFDISKTSWNIIMIWDQNNVFISERFLHGEQIRH